MNVDLPELLGPVTISVLLNPC